MSVPPLPQIPGLLSAPPFGGNVRTVVIKADPELLRAHNLTPDQLVAALRINNQTSPSGNVRIGDKNYITPINSTIHTVKDFANIPLYTGRSSEPLFEGTWLPWKMRRISR